MHAHFVLVAIVGMCINLIRHDCGDIFMEGMYLKGKMIGIDYYLCSFYCNWI